MKSIFILFLSFSSVSYAFDTAAILGPSFCTSVMASSLLVQSVDSCPVPYIEGQVEASFCPVLRGRLKHAVVSEIEILSELEDDGSKERVRQLHSFLESLGLSQLEPTQGERTYVEAMCESQF
ncbi:MAG: hypothetical protein AAF202_09635 [Pseudomonadota bacterium]